MVPLTISDDDKILIVTPHPDDESIATGGLIALYHDICSVWLITDGGKGCDSLDRNCIVSKRWDEFTSAMEFYKIADYRRFEVEDGRASFNEDILVNCDLSRYTKVFIPNLLDRHTDHIAVSKMVIKALKYQNNSSAQLFQYEVTEPLTNPTHCIDITSVIEDKIAAIEIYRSQTQLVDYCEMAKSLNRYRATINGMRDSYVEMYKRIETVNCDELLSDNIECSIQEMQYEIELVHRLFSLETDSYILKNYMNANGWTNICIYGYGRYGKIIERIVDRQGLSIEYFIDKYKCGEMTVTECGYDLKELSDELCIPDLVIIAIAKYNPDIEMEIRRCGFKEVKWLYDFLIELEVAI